MRVFAMTLCLGCVCLLSAHQTSGQNPATETLEPDLTVRIELDEHEHCFTLRFFVKNNGESEARVTYGRGDSGLEVVPHFRFAGLYISPPTHLRPARRALRPNVRKIPASSEILYGTFTLGYPQVSRRLSRDGDDELSALIRFPDAKKTLYAPKQRLKLPNEEKPEAPR